VNVQTCDKTLQQLWEAVSSHFSWQSLPFLQGYQLEVPELCDTTGDPDRHDYRGWQRHHCPQQVLREPKPVRFLLDTGTQKRKVKKERPHKRGLSYFGAHCAGMHRCRGAQGSAGTAPAN
jgi:hypothetical protein